MKVDLSDEQVTILVDLLNMRLSAIHPESDCSRILSVDESKYDSEVLQKLTDYLQEARSSEKARAAWEGYTETQEVPSNPPPGSCST